VSYRYCNTQPCRGGFCCYPFRYTNRPRCERFFKEEESVQINPQTKHQSSNENDDDDLANDPDMRTLHVKMPKDMIDRFLSMKLAEAIPEAVPDTSEQLVNPESINDHPESDPDHAEVSSSGQLVVDDSAEIDDDRMESPQDDGSGESPTLVEDSQGAEDGTAERLHFKNVKNNKNGIT
ncbi:unnamed protein product, partial [Anisakis simplex]|uniref:Secreted protein n=1 Tax=Anisakis simplex TaxID=6269 RepID=A0A0M3JJU0_ANISI